MTNAAVPQDVGRDVLEPFYVAAMQNGVHDDTRRSRPAVEEIQQRNRLWVQVSSPMPEEK
jgi:hypothetical protein